MVCFGPHVSCALLVREGLAAEERYGLVDGAGAVPGPTNGAGAPDLVEAEPVRDPRDADTVPGSSTGDRAVPDPSDGDPLGDGLGAGAVPDPFDDAEALEELEEEITTLAAHIHAATHRLLTLIAEFDRRRGWELGGHRSCAHWLSYCTGYDLGTAREKVRTARALGISFGD